MDFELYSSIFKYPFIMKNLLFTLVLLFSLHSYGQSNPVADAFIIMAYDVEGTDNALVVPDDKYWIIIKKDGNFYYSGQDYFNQYNESMRPMEQGRLYPAGTMIWHDANVNYNLWHLIVTEHNLITDTSLSSTNVESPNQIRLFPNPTTSEVVLNSDKQYDIEVYDILGNKVMELTGNTIDMEHLSSATYIVNALDTETNERLSYKVIKN